MDIRALDTLDEAAARELVSTWAQVPRWVDAVVADRPYGSVDELRTHAAGLAASWTDAEVEAALAHHPRIGERPTGDDASSAASRHEQASATRTDEATARALRDGNAAYERRFDRVFLVRAAGRTAPEILAELERRLRNDDATERAEVAVQLLEIALLRMERSLT
ncbi:2-oxo-4-hydroxy-4-carboxy-5-ureidoimidazoline decarboxylase [Curtobacterium sp. 22159]|uniref:2-oxo-4-hydroxy-4-carboxy-5-ureidoimidazoline decarboxylase n=1 Tax=Curtobacterium sp. 22159 TaxID=3453882 RepID=UPI003F86E1F0